MNGLPFARLKPAALSLAFWAPLSIAIGLTTWSLAPSHYQMYPGIARDYAEHGEALIHGVAGSIAFRMPAAGLIPVLLFNHGGLSEAWRLAPAFLEAGLVFALACLLRPAGGRLASLALVFLLFLDRGSYYANLDEAVFSLFVLAVAAAMACKEQKPSRTRVWAVALAVGASFLYRSSLVLLPPVLVVDEWFRDRAPERRRWSAMLVLGLAPYAFLPPWVWMNWRLFGRFVPFENVAANTNIVTGALGLIGNVEGDYRLVAANLGVPAISGSVFIWAVKEVGLHPLRYAGAVAARILRTLSWHPLLFGFAGLGLWRHRRQTDYRALGLFSLYFAGILWTMPVSERYFQPLFPILALLAASAFLSDARPRIENFSRRIAGFALNGWLAVELALCLYASIVVVSYGRGIAQRPPESDASLDAALQESPGDVWLLSQRGMRRLQRGRTLEALADFSLARSRAPLDEKINLMWASTLALQGKPEPLLSLKVLTLHFETSILRADYWLRAGRPNEARRELREAVRFNNSQLIVHGDGSDQEREIFARLHSYDSGLLSRAREALQGRPEDEQRRLVEELSALAPDASRLPALAARGVRSLDSSGWTFSSWLESRGAAALRPRAPAGPTVMRTLEEARAAQARGQKEAALQLIDKAQGLRPVYVEHLSMMTLYLDLGAYDRAETLIARLLRGHPQDAFLHLELAESALKQGRPELARRRLDEVRPLTRDDEEHMRILSRDISRLTTAPGQESR